MVLVFRQDDYGGGIVTAADLAIDAEKEVDNVFQWGNIERRSDVDMFRFSTGAGNVEFNINPFQENPNLDIEATLYDENGSVIATSNPLNELSASFDLFLNTGTYYLGIDGVGREGRYSDYGSIGFYTIEGTVIAVGGESIGETGVINFNDRWQTVTLSQKL